MSHQFADSHVGLPRRVWPHEFLACDLLPCWSCDRPDPRVSTPVLHGAWTSFIRHTEHDGQYEVFRLVCGHTTSGWADTNRWSLPIFDATRLSGIRLP